MSEPSEQTSSPQESTDELQTFIQPRRSRFGFWKKRYGLFTKERGKAAALTQIFDFDLPKMQVEMYLPDGINPEQEYQFGEIDSNLVLKSLRWRITRRGGPKPSKPVWDRLAEDVDEAVEPLQKTFGALLKLRQAVDDAFSPVDSTGGPGDDGNMTPAPDLMKTALVKQSEMYGKVIDSMANSIGSGVGTMLFPWSVPGNWPITLQALVHPGVRQGLKELTKDLVSDVSDGIAEGGARLLAKQTPKTGSGVASMADLLKGAERPAEPVVSGTSSP